MKINTIDVDFSPLYEVTSNDKNLSLKLLELIHKSLGELSLNIKEAYDTGDIKQVSHYAHKLKSSIAYINVSDFNSMLLQLEALKNGGILTKDFSPMIDNLVNSSSEIKEVVAAEINNLI
ncbi:Hpt domain-containing protein [Sediminitomix flava]|uniref:Hpt domain-containing protein n=1 Tax=Sediminitomix flava TaxID=379075 RepID=A0A315ZV99_SEDFL|nr:Hpt domain-containing protein [Sediminitomix flava]PWJ40129.1 Hpt domain-containing protein [Sediminitomix flava]